MTPSRPPVWQMVKEAAEHLATKSSVFTNADLRDYVNSKWSGVNPSTLACQIIICTVNHPSRVHYPENKRPRRARSQYDILFRPGRGLCELYDAARQGEWEIASENGRLVVREVVDVTAGEDAPDLRERESTQREDQLASLALESELRDLLARSLPNVPGLGQLTLYQHDDGRDGVEFITDVGVIDLLTKTPDDSFCILELKLLRGPDATLGQVQRYMGWVQHHLAAGKSVWGVIIASQIGEKLKYAATQAPRVRLLEYELKINVRPVQLAAPTEDSHSR